MNHALLIHRAQALRQAALDSAQAKAPVVAPSLARQPDVGAGGGGRRALAPFFGAGAVGAAAYLLVPRLAPSLVTEDGAAEPSPRRTLFVSLALSLTAFLVLQRVL